MIALGAVIREIAIATFRTKPVVGGNRLEQRGFPGAVLARKETDSGTKSEFFEMTDRRDREGVAVPVAHSLAEQCNFL